jgi:hypothetical protein
MQHAMGIPERCIARGADELRARAKPGLTNVTTPSGSTLRKRSTKKGQAFLNDFEAIPCKFSSDGYLYQVKDIAEFSGGESCTGLFIRSFQNKPEKKLDLFESLVTESNL